jgi:hypothetical protein
MNLELIKKEAANFNYTNAGFEADLVAFAKLILDKATVWRPIDEAPKDGTEIDVWNGHERIADVSWEHPYGYAKGYMNWCTCVYELGHGYVFYQVQGITHYMNKPPAPEAA